MSAGVSQADLSTGGSSTGGALVAYIQNATGAIQRTAQDKERERVSVYDFMSPAQIVGSQTATAVDHTSAFLAAAAACVAAGVDSHLHIPCGIYNISQAINIAFSGVVSGSGTQDTIIRLTNATQNGFTTIGSYGHIVFRDMQIATTVTKTAGAGILLNTANATDPAQLNARINNVYFNGQYEGFKALNATYWGVHACIFSGSVQNAIYSDCTSNFDAGDNSIGGGTLISGGSTGVGINLVNNCRITNTKILGHSTGIFISPSAAAGTRVDFQIGSAVSIEGQSNYGIRVSVTAAGTGVADSSIIGVQTGITANNAKHISIEGPVGGWVVANNFCVLSGTGQVGIQFVNNGSGFANSNIIANNLLTGGDSTSLGIFCDSLNTLLSDNNVVTGGTTITTNNTGVTVRGHTCSFATLPGPVANGSMVYCVDGTTANPVASGGTGCIAKRLNGVWVGN